jgi:hypothetical protein
MVTLESVFVTELRHAEYFTTWALEDSALAMAIPPPTNATAPAVAATLLQSFMIFLTVSFDAYGLCAHVTRCRARYCRKFV